MPYLALPYLTSTDETQSKEFVAGDWNKSGAVCFVMEMLCTDDLCFQVRCTRALCRALAAAT